MERFYNSEANVPGCFCNLKLRPDFVILYISIYSYEGSKINDELHLYKRKALILFRFQVWLAKIGESRRQSKLINRPFRAHTSVVPHVTIIYKSAVQGLGYLREDA